MDEPLIPCEKVVYKPKRENSEPKPESVIVKTSKHERIMDRFIMIESAAVQAFFVGYFDELHKVKVSSIYDQILEEFAAYYGFEITAHDEWMIYHHYFRGKQSRRFEEGFDEKTKQEIRETGYSYENLIKDLEEQQIPCQTLRKIFAGYPDYEQNIKYNKQKTK